MASIQVPETALRRGIFAGIALLLVTPFVVTPGTIFPFVVGKALWSRSIIGIVFALWAVLALANPAWRPPRSRVLLLFAASLCISFVAACFGVSLQRSLWSSYERMQGLVDAAHWFALAVVLASMLRSSAGWRALLGLNVAAGAAMACLVIARYHNVHLPFFGAIPELHLPRMSGPTGNPTFLGIYMLFNLLLALGFAVQAWLPGAAPETAPRRRGGQRSAVAKQRVRAAGRWPGGLLRGAAAALLLCGLGLAGSVGGFAGLLAGIGFAALCYAFLGRGRVRWIALAVLAALGVLAVGVGLRVVDLDRRAAAGIDRSIASYVASVHVQRPGVQSRLAAWEAGLEGFAARPVLGWGPENFVVVFGRFASGYGAVAKPHDQAHGKFVEVVATTGVLGVTAWVALWATAFLVLWRAARGMSARERVVAVFVGAAMFGTLVQSQFLFDTAIGSLQTVLLLGYLASLEAADRPVGRGPRLPAWLARAWLPLAGSALLRRGRARIALGVAAVAVAASGLAVNHAIHAAADVNHLPRRDWSLRDLAGGIDGFAPLANAWRWRMFDELALHWPRIRAADGARARRLLDWAGSEAEAVLRTEPESWRIQQSLARLYRAAAVTDPGYGGLARRHLERVVELAPNRPVFAATLEPPGTPSVRRLEDGRHELRWRPSPGAGYHVVSVSRNRGPWQNILHAYDAARTSFVPPAQESPGIYRYRIRACRNPGDCGALAAWPPVTMPGGPSVTP